MDISCEVYNALSDIMFETGAKKEDMERAIQFFQTHFFEFENDEDVTM